MHRLLLSGMQNILQSIDEGIHIVDKNGVTIYYNKAMCDIEGLSENAVIGKHLQEIYPDWTRNDSTMLQVLEDQEPIYDHQQSYFNFRGKKITSLNTTLPIMENGMLLGAVEISKNYTEMTSLSNKIIELQEKLSSKKPKEKRIKHYTFDNLIGLNKSFLKAIKIAKRAAESNSSVLIFGETGTGKELFAQSIHYSGLRHDLPFIAQNCAALPENLLEGILFGTTKGSFTGADDRPGLFEQADGGTLFLDEINSMSPGLQAKILRALQESYIRRVGGDKDIPIDVRVIAATNENPVKLVENKQLRADLYYRLNVIGIRIPPLRERLDDLQMLTNYFIDIYNENMHKEVIMVSQDVMDLFKSYNWVGNIRELRNAIETAMNMVSDDHVITKEHIPQHFDEFLVKTNIVQPEFKMDFENLENYMESIERSIIMDHMKYAKGNITKASQSLGIKRQGLQYKLKKYNITMQNILL